jgi:hypothetical protein
MSQANDRSEARKITIYYSAETRQREARDQDPCSPRPMFDEMFGKARIYSETDRGVSVSQDFLKGSRVL